ncbi:MAG: carboxylating nicotinate-nucleotide diphosphorylase [bacterium]|nr:carboxylating nicotinate-nucleotide diphosphorylase [bacterium]
MNHLETDAIVRAALVEDIGGGDVTTELLPEAMCPARGTLLAKAPGVLCGGGVALRCFQLLDEAVKAELFVTDGSELKDGSEIGEIRGSAATLLVAERVALNFLQHLSGVATIARRMAVRAVPHGIRIVETRKTMPGMRALEKYAVQIGGGYNHRHDLSSAVLLKDNHFALSQLSPGDLVRYARANASHALRVIAEATDPELVEELAAAGADVILLDNFAPEEVRLAVRTIAGRAVVEVSGGVNEANLDAYLIPGVDVISIGALTHSVHALDISLEIEPA